MSAAEAIDRQTKRKQILSAVMAEHGFGSEDFFSRRRTDDLVDARRDAAKRLLAAGFAPRRVAEILKRNVSTITYYASGEMKSQKRWRARVWRLLHMLPNEDRETIQRLATARCVSPYDMARDWLIERARFEASNVERLAA